MPTSALEDGSNIWRIKEREQQWQDLTAQADLGVYQKRTQLFLRALADNGASDNTVLFPLSATLRAYREPGNDLSGIETACWLPDIDSLADLDTKIFIQSVLHTFELGMARVKNYHLRLPHDKVFVVNGMRRHVCHHLASHAEVYAALGAAVCEATEVMRKTYLGTSAGKQALRHLLGEGNTV